MNSDEKRWYLLILGITVIGAFFRFYGIADQPPLTDDAHVVFSAYNYMERGQMVPTMPHHPKLRNILVYGSTGIVGTGAFGVRGASLLFGVLSPPLLGILLYRLTANTAASALAALFLAIDPVHIMFSRQAIQEVHTTFFILAGTHLALQSMRETVGALSRARLLLSGVLFGLGLASKAHALIPIVLCAAVLVFMAVRAGNVPQGVHALLALTVLPFTVYLVTYAPWFARGYTLADWFFMQRSLSYNVMTDLGHQINAAVDTEAWQWFIRPFMGWGNFAYFDDKPYVSIAMGNPLLWLLVLPSSIYLLFRSGKEQASLMLQGLFWSSYLPLALAQRPITIFSSLAVTPFAYCLMGIAIARWTAERYRMVLYGYIFAALMVTVVFFPLSIGNALDHHYPKIFVERFNPHPQEGK